MNALPFKWPTKFVGGLVALVVGVGTVLLVPGVAYALFPDVEEGILIEEVVHELPAPAVSLASTGQSLVVYSSARPDDTTNQFCNENGPVGSPGLNEGCAIVGRIVAADGVTVSDPILMSGDLPIGYYFSAPSVTWNDTHSEWLVLMHTWVVGFRGTYAQRVSTTGELLGPRVKLPTSFVTEIDDRSVATPTNDIGDEVQAHAVWSEIDNAYFVAWSLRYDSPAKYAIVGYLMTRTLESLDGVDAAFFLSNPSTDSRNNVVSLGFSSDTNEWVVAYGYDSSANLVARAIKIAGSVAVASDEFVVRTPHPDETNVILSGGVLWVPSLNSWLLSWSERRNTDVDGTNVPMWQVYGRYLSGDLFAPSYSPGGDLIALTNFNAFFEEVDYNPSRVVQLGAHVLTYDPVADVIYGAGHFRYQPTGISADWFIATYWTFDAQNSEPLSVTSVVSSAEDQDVRHSSRPRMSAYDSGLVLVYQNWPQGIYSDPSEVRFLTIEPVGRQIDPPSPPLVDNPERSATSNRGGNATSSNFEPALAATGVGPLWLLSLWFGAVAITVGAGLALRKPRLDRL